MTAPSEERYPEPLATVEGSIAYVTTWFAEVRDAALAGNPYLADSDDVTACIDRLVKSWPPTFENAGEAAGLLMLLLVERNYLRSKEK